MLLAIVRTESLSLDIGPDTIAFYNNQATQIKGTVSEPPTVEDSRVKLVVEVAELQVESNRLPVKGKALIITSLYPRFDYGDQIEAEGYLQEPPAFEDFSYRDYLARYGVFSLMSYPKITLLNRGHGNPLRQALQAIRKQALSIIGRILANPEAALLSGILLGEYRALPKTLSASFSATGTSHIIVISGFNITLLATILLRVFNEWVPRRQAVFGSMGGVILYTLLVGADPAVSRAALMGCTILMAVLVGRANHTPTSLALAILLMTAWDPLALWDISFQLSVGATLGLILFASPIYEYIHHTMTKPGLSQSVLPLVKDALIATFAAQVFTLPLILYNFQRFSVIMPLANALVLPIQPLVMGSGALALLAGWIWLPAGQIVGWLAWLFLTYTIRLVELLASIPFASVQIGTVPLWLLYIYYGAVLGFLWLSKQNTQKRQDVWRMFVKQLTPVVVVGTLFLVSLVIWAAAFSVPDGQLHVRFLNVGQGDAILITLPGGKQILIDGGPSPQALLSELGRAMPFWDHRLELLVLSHPDQDHLIGLLSLFEKYDIEQVIDCATHDRSELSLQWQKELRDRATPIQKACAGMTIDLSDGAHMDVLHPNSDELSSAAGDSNNTSTVLRLVYGQVSFLFTGDLEQEGEHFLLQKDVHLDSTLLKVSHHGANEATTEAFVQAVSPQVAIISVGSNRFGHPAPQTLQRLSSVPVLRTDRVGTIDIQTDGIHLWSNKYIEHVK